MAVFEKIKRGLCQALVFGEAEIRRNDKHKQHRQEWRHEVRNQWIHPERICPCPPGRLHHLEPLTRESYWSPSHRWEEFQVDEIRQAAAVFFGLPRKAQRGCVTEAASRKGEDALGWKWRSARLGPCRHCSPPAIPLSLSNSSAIKSLTKMERNKVAWIPLWHTNMYQSYSHQRRSATAHPPIEGGSGSKWQMHQELDEGHALVSSDFGHEPIIQDTQPPIILEGWGVLAQGVTCHGVRSMQVYAHSTSISLPPCDCP